MEIDEPTNIVEDLPGYPLDVRNKRTGGIFADDSNSCCPTKVEVIEPLGGKNRKGKGVQNQDSMVHEQLKLTFYGFRGFGPTLSRGWCTAKIL